MVETDYEYKILLSVGCITLLLGALGNALTIAALAYETLKKKCNFDGCIWITTTVYIFNLAVVEFLYCLVVIVKIIYGEILRNSADTKVSPGACQFFLLGQQQLGVIDGWSLALIAVTRAFPLIKYVKCSP